jgi:ribosomal protein S18 acetylase RimI-like enzyme
LVADLLGRAQAEGVARIDVVAGPARGFYERLGFVVVGEAETRFGAALELRRAVPLARPATCTRRSPSGP